MAVAATSTGPAITSDRVESIDIVRGVTILVMLFVNDVAGVAGTPAWMLHVQPPDADGMTFVDVVFPAFLFIVGMAIPFAIGKRLERGDNLVDVWKHILVRTASLLIIGVFMVNAGDMATDSHLGRHGWTLLMYGGVILVWNRPPAAQGRRRNVLIALRWLGVVILIAAAVLFRGPAEGGIIELRPKWWGILGLIGWSYLVACTVYLALRHSHIGVLGAMSLLYCIYFADAAGAFADWTFINSWLSIGGTLGSHPAITVSGVVLGMVLTKNSLIESPSGRIRWALLYGAGLALAAHLLHAMADLDRAFIINKIFATPPWCLWTSAITVWIWVATYWVVDVRRWKRWTALVEPAGQNALFAYILAPILYSLFVLLEPVFGVNVHAALGQSFAVGFWRALVFAFAMTWLAGALRHVGIRLRL
jgi:predicted acyltransferase